MGHAGQYNENTPDYARPVSNLIVYGKPASGQTYKAHSAAATERSGQIIGHSKDGFPIRAADQGVLGGYHFRKADIASDIACGGSQAIFVVVGLGLGWLLANKFVDYVKKV